MSTIPISPQTRTHARTHARTAWTTQECKNTIPKVRAATCLTISLTHPYKQIETLPYPINVIVQAKERLQVNFCLPVSSKQRLTKTKKGMTLKSSVHDFTYISQIISFFIVHMCICSIHYNVRVRAHVCGRVATKQGLNGNKSTRQSFVRLEKVAAMFH